HRSSSSFRGYSGKLVSGSIKVGDEIRVLPSGSGTTIKEIISGKKYLNEASQGQIVTCTTTNDVSVNRGDVFSFPENPPQISDHFQMKIISLHEEDIAPGCSYLLRSHNKEIRGTVTGVKHV